MKDKDFRDKEEIGVLNYVIKILLRMSRTEKRALQIITDVVLLALSFGIAMVLRLESISFARNLETWLAVCVAVPVAIVLFERLGFYRVVVRYISGRAIRAVVIGILASAAALLITSQLLGLSIPRSVPVIYAIIALLMIGGVRFLLRVLFSSRERGRKRPVIIYGAGSSGRQLVSSLQQGREYAPVAFVDDAASLHGTEIGGVPVYAPTNLEHLVQKSSVRLILLAVPSASKAQRKAILERLEPLPVRVQTVPGMSDLISGKAKIDEFQNVSIEDLLGRDPVPPRDDLMKRNIQDKVLMVTGAGGSIGSELCRQIIRLDPVTLIILDISEAALYSIDNELKQIAENESRPVRIVPLLGSVHNAALLNAAVRRFGVQIVYHAAAYKHVPLLEENVVEGLHNNVFGTRTLADVAIATGVEGVFFISTDKAVRPTSVMGASKRLAELICQDCAARQATTLFSVVRFGNVLGSSGSVIPRFRSQIESGGPVTVTDPNVTRYFMTLQEAAELVLQASAMAKGGDVFVLDMGEPIRIVDLAERIIRLSGLTAYRANGSEVSSVSKGDIGIVFTGLRPGEKLHEELLIGNRPSPTSHPRIMTTKEAGLETAELDRLLDRLFDACTRRDIRDIRELLGSGPIGYQPWVGTVDLIRNEASFKDKSRKGGASAETKLPNFDRRAAPGSGVASGPRS